MTIFSNINSSHFSSFHILLLYISYFNNIYAQTISNQMQIPVPVRVVVDTNSSFGAMVNLCMDMAISDFYFSHSNYETRLHLINKDAKNTLDLNLAVVELVKHEQVLAILGSQGSMQETFAAAVGEAALVPIVSFTARSSALSYTQNSYVFRTSLDDAVEAEALAAICGRFGWSEAVIFYEDTQFGNQFLSHTIKAFQYVGGIRLTYMAAIPLSAEDSHIKHQLNMVNAKPTRVFLVHMNHVLGSRLFTLANAAGMTMEGYAWIVTDSISIFLNSINAETLDSMDGVVGIRPYVFSSIRLKSFLSRWKRNMIMTMSENADPVMQLNIYGLWAYDTVTALAIAVENTKPLESSFGPRLVSELSKTKFGGLAGDFELVDGKLKGGGASAYEIFNIIGSGERRVGFWSRERGITGEVSENGEGRKVFWPGESVTQPKGWSIPPTGNLRVGIPWRYGFIEFVNVVVDPKTNQTHASGLAVDVFLQALEKLPFQVNYTFYCINASTEGNLDFDTILRSNIKEFDIVVADTTIWAPRAEYMDFSLPYSESGLVLVVKNNKPFDMWIFIRPLGWDLWLAIVVASVLIGIVLCILENRDEPRVIYWSPIALLVFQDKNEVSNKWSVFVLVCWIFMAFILMQSFTANLSAILTLDQLKFSFSGDYYVGYQEGSFTRKFLTEELSFKTSILRGYSSIQGFHDGMRKGSKNGGIDIIIDELPYAKLLLNRYKSQYKIVGPTYYNTDGIGFAFPPESPLVRYFSKAILNVTQGPTMSTIQRKNFGPGYSSQDPLSSVISQGTSSLALHQFTGLFLVTGSFVLFALFCSATSIGRKLTHIIQSCLTFRTPRVHSTELSSFVSGSNGSHQLPPDDAQVIPQQEASDISEMALENESSTAAQSAGEGIRMRNS